MTHGLTHTRPSPAAGQMENNTRCRIGDRYFDTTEEAEEWVEVGGIGGTYVYQVYCPDHLGWFDEVYDKVADELVCTCCYEQRQEERRAKSRAWVELESAREADRRKLAAWNEGRPIVSD